MRRQWAEPALRRVVAVVMIGMAGGGLVSITTAQIPAPAERSGGDGGAPAFELVDGDRVVLLGSGFIEAAQEFGFIELVLTTRWPDRRIIFRNLGWSGDTVFGEARARFTSPPTPYERLLGDATAPDPTVIFVGYGSNVPFEENDTPGRSAGSALALFEDGLRSLLDDLQDRTGARIVLLSPPPLEAASSPSPAEIVHRTNEGLAEVSETIARVARERGHFFVDVFNGLMEANRHTRLTDDGIRLDRVGHRELARVIAAGLGLEIEPSWMHRASGESARRVTEQEQLRQLIIQKDLLYFEQYRPANETYLIGFRSYEQGQNAVELEQLTPLIETLDHAIDRSKRRIASKGGVDDS